MRHDRFHGRHQVDGRQCHWPECEEAGEFRAPANYLEFDDAASCVEQVGRLLDDAALRAAQMQENWAYYTRWMRPDALARYVVDQMGH